MKKFLEDSDFAKRCYLGTPTYLKSVKFSQSLESVIFQGHSKSYTKKVQMGTHDYNAFTSEILLKHWLYRLLFV